MMVLEPILYILLGFILAYIIGSIPFGLVITKVFTKQDITKIGSGNIGATNVLRTGNKKLALFTLFLDVSKGIFAIVVFAYISSILAEVFPSCIPSASNSNIPSPCSDFPFRNFDHVSISNDFSNLISIASLYPLLIGLFAILGHCYPIWLKFKGGKGVATALGVLLAAVPFTGLLTCLTWIISAMAARISSLAAISAMVCAPAFTYTFYGLYPALINVLISLLVIWRHRENIARIRKGTEPKIGDKKDEPEK